jgi:hypothetical protein
VEWRGRIPRFHLGFLAGADAVERLGQKRVKATADNADNQSLRQRLGFNRLMRSAALELDRGHEGR